MKRYGNLWQTLVSFPNLLLAAQKAARGKRGLANVAKFRFRLEDELVQLQDELTNRTYRPGVYRTFEIFEPKHRLISAAPFRDRLVHHALCNVLEPVFERTFIYDSYACRKGKGTHAAIDRAQEFAKRNPFVLKCDLQKFFPSVDHDVLKVVIRKKIKDITALWLIDTIIDASNEQQSVNAWFPGDTLLTPAERRRGLPIGNQTSQFFANVLLNTLDHFLRDHLAVPGYVRYVDDFVVFGNDKRELSRIRENCRAYLAEYRLRLHPKKCIISPTAVGFPFLGVRIFPDRRRLPRQNLVRARRRIVQMQAAFAAGDLSLAAIGQRLRSWQGHLIHADAMGLLTDVLGSTIFSRTNAYCDGH